MLKDRRLTAIVVATLLAVTVWAQALLPHSGNLEITMMDVGEGLCIVVRSPDRHILVMDCGTCSWRNNSAVGTSVVVPYLRSLGADHIDIAVLSHPHADHMSGFRGLLKQIPARLVLDSSEGHTKSHNAFLSHVRRSGAEYRIARRGQAIELGGGAVAQVLSPAQGKDHQDLNDASIVLRLVYKDTSVLLQGDAAEDAEHEILESRAGVRSNVLQVGHHGSRKSTSPRWLGAVKPQVAIISCGRKNIYGHPSRETLTRLTASGAKIFRTDRQGAISLTSDGRTIRVRGTLPGNNH
jgi:competence protein ComEC